MLVKICGLSNKKSIEAAIIAGADLIGFVFHPKSPRFIYIDSAISLADSVRGKAKIVALLVDPSDEMLTAIISQLKPDFVQLHGMETIERVIEIKHQFKAPIIKVIGVENPVDIDVILQYSSVADLILLDAKPPKGSNYPGGHGVPFDWKLLQKLPSSVPFILSGGLNPSNIGDAIKSVQGLGLNLLGVDVSSGVESALGVKDNTKIADFVSNVRKA